MWLPWWLKIGAKLVLSRLPVAYGVWQRLGLFRHGEMDRAEYALRVFDSHVENCALQNRLQGKLILELGSGDSIATAIIASANQARSILVDTGRFVQANVELYKSFSRSLQGVGLIAPDLSDSRNLEDILARCESKYFTCGLKSLKQIASGSVDLIFSQAVLEHVRRRDFLDAMRECRRILKTEGVCSHRIDLKDHLGGALNNLRFSESIWESEFFAKSGFYTNRIQFKEMLSLFNKAGFDVEVTRVRRWSELPNPRHKLAEPFRELADEELCVSGFNVVLRCAPDVGNTY